MAELKPRSMRMSDENYQKLQGLSEGRSIDETIGHLLEINKRDTEKLSLGSQAVKLDELDEMLDAVRSQFAALIKLSQNAKEAVRCEFQNELRANKEEINKLNEELVDNQRNIIKKEASFKKELEEADLKVKEFSEINDSNRVKIKSLEEAALRNKQAMDSLSNALAAAEKNAFEADTIKKRSEELTESNKSLNDIIEKLNKNIEKLNKDNEELREKYKAVEKSFDKEKENALNEKNSLTSMYDKRIENLLNSHKSEIEAVKREALLDIREARIKAESQINTIKSEYQDKMLELISSEKKSMVETNQNKPNK